MARSTTHRFIVLPRFTMQSTSGRQLGQRETAETAWLRHKTTEAAKLENDKTTRSRINHERIDQLLANPLTADPDAAYAKQLYFDLGSISRYVSSPNSVKVATQTSSLPRGSKLTAHSNILPPLLIQFLSTYNTQSIVFCTNSRASGIAEAARVFKDAAKANPEVKPKIADGVQLYIAAASAPEQAVAETVGDWQAFLDAGA
ncbi:hypothetical protein GGR58DRAFT_505136 [Xylaria digitata]|nr:hypothetical protein GGR58DRAFT_505136 [Xylaria digitata]